VLLITANQAWADALWPVKLMARAQVTGATVLVGECFAEGTRPTRPLRSDSSRLPPPNLPATKGVAGRESAPSPVESVLDGEPRAGALLEPGMGVILADLITIAPALRTAYPDVPPNLLLEPQAERQRIFGNVVPFRSAERARPILLFIDDVHWADTAVCFCCITWRGACATCAC